LPEGIQCGEGKSGIYRRDAECAEIFYFKLSSPRLSGEPSETFSMSTTGSFAQGAEKFEG
jgi:hypothetical protein